MTIADKSLPIMSEGNADTTKSHELVTQFQETFARCMQLACMVCVRQLSPDVVEQANELTISYTYSLHDDNHRSSISLK